MSMSCPVLHESRELLFHFQLSGRINESLCYD